MPFTLSANLASATLDQASTTASDPAHRTSAFAGDARNSCKRSAGFHKDADQNRTTFANHCPNCSCVARPRPNTKANVEVTRKRRLELRNLSQNQKNLVIFRAGTCAKIDQQIGGNTSLRGTSLGSKYSPPRIRSPSVPTGEAAASIALPEPPPCRCERAAEPSIACLSGAASTTIVPATSPPASPRHNSPSVVRKA